MLAQPAVRVMPVREALPMPGAVAVPTHAAPTHAAPIYVESGALPPDCCPDCCEGKAKKCKRYCVPEASTKKKTHTEYSCKEDEICRSRCFFCGLLTPFHRTCHSCNTCDSCNEGCRECGRVRTRRRLVKRFKTEECPITKCVPPKDCCEEHAPAK